MAAVVDGSVLTTCLLSSRRADGGAPTTRTTRTRTARTARSARRTGRTGGTDRTTGSRARAVRGT